MIKLRAHHLVCIPRFKGGGYNKKVRERIFSIQGKIKKNPNIKIKIIKKYDEVCMACPFMEKNKCIKRENINYYIKKQDDNVLKKLKIKENKAFPAKEIFNLSINKIKNNELRKICRGCEFLSPCLKYGLNKSFIGKLKWY